MKKMTTIFLIISTAIILSNANAETSDRQQLRETMEKRTTWVWDTLDQTLSICFSINDQPKLCTKVPNQFLVTRNTLDNDIEI